MSKKKKKSIGRKQVKELPPWKVAENVAAALEKFASPDSEVLRNQFLPVIGRPERKPRQCDVVIKHQVGPREFKAIVEVQKRKGKPDITTFHGWLEKKREVGAQQLICVSQAGYPSSIVQEVNNKYGDGTVSLMTLTQFDWLASKPELNIIPIFTFEKRNITNIVPGEQVIDENGEKHSDKLVSIEEKVFTLGEDGVRLTLIEVVESILIKEVPKINLHPKKLPKVDLRGHIKIGHLTNLVMHLGDDKIKVLDWTLTVDFRHELVEVPPDASFKYGFTITNNTLAYMTTATMTVKGKLKVFELVFRPNGDQIAVGLTINDKT